MNTTLHYEAANLALFSMQLLGSEEHAAMADHLSHCTFCRQELSRVQGDLTIYASALEPQTPAPSIRERVLRRASREKKLPPPTLVKPLAHEDRQESPERLEEPDLTFATRRGHDHAPSIRRPVSEDIDPIETGSAGRIFKTALPYLGWVVAAGLALTGAKFYRAHDSDQQRISALTRALEQDKHSSSASKLLFDTLTDPSAQQVMLSSPVEVSGPAPQGRVIYGVNRKALIFFANNLDQLPPEKTYELWLIPADGRDPIPAGTFHPGTKGDASVILPPLSQATEAKAFGVTVEDATGSPTPTMPIILAGN